jgi:hypothetical protein
VTKKVVGVLVRSFVRRLLKQSLLFALDNIFRFLSQ